MKRIEAATLILAFLLCPIRSQAVDYVELYKTDRAAYLKAITCTDDESIAQGLYSDFTGADELKDKAVTAGASKDVVAEYKKKKAEREKASTTTVNKGYVSSIDELHVIGLPSDSDTGYTPSGCYSDTAGGTDVYGYDELHVIGAPSRPDGYTAGGRYRTMEYYSGGRNNGQ